jgi:hypothetical protein
MNMSLSSAAAAAAAALSSSSLSSSSIGVEPSVFAVLFQPSQLLEAVV